MPASSAATNILLAVVTILRFYHSEAGFHCNETATTLNNKNRNRTKMGKASRVEMGRLSGKKLLSFQNVAVATDAVGNVIGDPR